MAQTGRVTAPELEQFIVVNVQLTGEKLGAGAYGSVEEVEIPGARVAAKKLHSQLVNLGTPTQVEKWVKDFVEECKLMSQLHHPHIVQFLGVCYLPGSPLPTILMEKLLTSLDNLLETNPNIPLDVQAYLLTGTVRGVVYLHSRTPPIAHRDLTARNILIDSGLTAKIADLGVARMVNVPRGQLAATMTSVPGNNLYMPPEAVQEEGAAHYNTAIDMFSFGVVSLFTLTQIFPKDLKPATYRDPTTRRIVGRSEIERRENYIEVMQIALGETHSLVKLTLDCLEYDPEDRPSAVEVLRRLEEVEKETPKNYTKTKLELIQQVCRKEEEIQQDRMEHKRQLKEKDNQYLAQLSENSAQIRCLQAEKVCSLEKLTTLQQQQLEAKDREIEQLSRLLKLQSQEEGSQRPKQGDMPVASPRKKLEVKNMYRENEQLSKLLAMAQSQEEGSQGPMPPPPEPPMLSSFITFNWTRCKNRPPHMFVYDQPVALNQKLYARGESGWTVVETVLEYTPGDDNWATLTPSPVKRFTIATLRGQLLVVGGVDKSTDKVVNTILTFDEHSKQWIQSYPDMPTALTYPAVREYQDHLIVAGGCDSAGKEISYVSILTINNEWIAAESLLTAGVFNTVLVEDTMYLVGWNTRTVLRAHVPTLISGCMSGVWESLSDTPYYQSPPIAIDDTLLTVGGNDRKLNSPTTSIQMYNPTCNQWTRVGALPEQMYNSHRCIALKSELFVLGNHVYVSALVRNYTL